MVLVVSAIVFRLFTLQVLSHDFYAALASDQHGIFEELFPERGSIYLTDSTASDGRFPAAINRETTLVYAVPRLITSPKETAEKLTETLGLEPEGVEPLTARLSLEGDPYEPVARKVPDETAERLRAMELPGIGFTKEAARFYPETTALSHVLGFVGSDDEGNRVGRYGIEGYWNGELSGTPGFLAAERDAIGRWIGAGDRTFVPAEDGADITLTIDRTIQYVACEKLRNAVARHGADGGAVIIMQPKTGAVLAMCGSPDFDPNDYSAVSDISVFNNPGIFSAYEPGSIFKPLTMAAAIDADKVTPTTLFEDTGEVKIGPYTIQNSDGKSNGIQTMTQVLEKSLNTGSIFAATQLGSASFREYVHAFGLGERLGIELETEAAGDISSLDKRGDIWTATASYGQGITATPLQMVTAYGALANGGKVMKPYIVAEVDHKNGRVDRTEPEVLRQAISKRASTLVAGMLVNVVENGHGGRAGVPGYWVGGKTGTAQIARAEGGGYEASAFNGSFVGFAPVDDPAFVMITRIDRPKDVEWAESSAAPLFGEIADFLLHYMEIPPDRPVN
jgi:cell division protein FtsI/penicillin-binding protein 2